MEQEFILEARNITKVYPGGVVANHNVNLQIKKGEIHALVGENGAGKSTVLKSIARQLETLGGSIYLDQKELSRRNTFPISCIHFPTGIRDIISSC